MTSSSDPQRLGELLNELMRLIHERNSGETLEMLHEESLTMPQFVALHLLRYRGPDTLSSLGQALRLSSSATSSLVDRMVERGLLDRRQHPEDRRQKLVSITAQGRALADRLAATRTRELEQAFSQVGPAVLARLNDVFEEVVAQLRAGGSP